jgi:ABC-type sugar transport system ATPase subunit
MKLKLENLMMKYPNGAVGVRNIDFEVDHGQLVVLLGPSGCGKSTLLRLISGLESPTQGEIHLDNQDITEWEPKRRDISLVFQNYALYPHMNVRENLEFGLKSRKIAKDERDKSVEWAANLLELGELLNRKPKELSGGQRQRVALGRAIVRKPKLYLYDEPLSNLDAELRMKMRGEILSLHKRVNGTSIYVTHDQTEAMSLADVIYIMNNGEIVASGPPSELYENPPDVFTAGFLGFPGMNLINGIIENGNFYSKNRLKIPLTGELPDQKIIMGIRPENIKINTDGDISGKIVSLENLGRSKLYYLELEGGEMIKTESIDDYNIGATVRLKIDSDMIFLYDKESGQLIK